MSKQPPPPPSSEAAASAAPSAHDHLSGVDISRVMSSTGPTVKCVLLRAVPEDGKCAASPTKSDEIDPSRDVGGMSIKEIKRELTSYGVDASSFVEKGELVKALLGAREEATNDADKKPSATNNGDLANDGEGAKIVTQDDDDKEQPSTKPVPLQHLIEEIDVDTTPRKSMVSQILGGPVTFLGQYEDEGIMVMVRRPDWEDEENSVDEKDLPPVNPHELQPPLHNVEVRGDILMMRVAQTEEVLDKDYEKEVLDAKDGDKDEGEAKEGASDDTKKSADASTEKSEKSPEIHVPTNDEFFLDYTREEYLKFAARTDIVAEEIESSSEEEGEESDNDVDGGEDGAKKPGSKSGAKAAALNGENGEDEGGDDEHDEDFDPEADDDSDDSDDDDLDSEEHQVGMMNMILGHMLRKFREENGRGPDSLELLEMRKALADRLGVDVPPVDEEACDWDKKAETPNKRSHGRKVVVAEEKNETEEIPRREKGSDEEDEDEEDVMDHDKDECLVEEVDGDEAAGLKRSAEDVDGGDEGGNKRAKLGDGEAASGIKVGGEKS